MKSQIQLWATNQLNDFRTENSQEAHKEVKPKLQALQNQIMYALRKLGRGTFYQIAEAANLEHQQVWKRLSELEKKGLIEPDGKEKGMNGRSVTVWKVC